MKLSVDSLNDSNDSILTKREIIELKEIQEKTKLRMKRDQHLMKELNYDDIFNNSGNSSSRNLLETAENIESNSAILSVTTQTNNDDCIPNDINPNKERIFTNLIPYFYYKGEPLIMISNNELKFYIFSYLGLSLATGVIYLLIKEHTDIMKVMLTFLYTASSFSYFLLIIKNPGIPKDKRHFDIEVLKRNYIQCKGCNCIYERNSRTVHCESCEICIENYDHHCPYSSKCISKSNDGIFKVFIFSVSLLVFCLGVSLFL